ncbi:MAG: MFS transporter [Tepidanaerobacteraceae bacterium]|nr:MFS transporter [Tepidanaerobacteraceae bacterium]
MPPENNSEKPQNEKRMLRANFNAISFDAIFFNTASAFLDPGTVIPSFVSMLTDSPVLIGLTTTIRNCGWFLPQLLVAHRVQALPYKKPVVLWAGASLRLSACIMALSALLATENPKLALLLFYFFFIILSFSDGITGVPWIDIFAKSIPPERRGKYYALTQFLGGSLAFGAGIIIKKILDSKHLAFPNNYFIIFMLGFILQVMSFASFTRVKEIMSETQPAQENLMEFLTRIPQLFRQDATLRKLILINTLVRFFFLPLPFYVIFASDKLGLSGDMVGYFVSSQMLGYILAGVIFGRINDYIGSRAVILITGFVTMLQPVFALISQFLHANGCPFIFLYTAIFALIGATYSGVWVGIFNYLLKIAPEENRPLYIGLLNTVTAPTTFLPIIGGFLINKFDYAFLFAASFIAVFAGFLASFALKEEFKAVQKNR